MKRVIYLLLTLVLASCGNSKTASLPSNTTTNAAVQASAMKVTAQSVLENMNKGKYVEGELLVKFKSGVVAQSLRTHRSLGAAVVRRFSVVPNLQHVKLPANLSVRDAVVRYMSDPNVEYAEPNYIRRISKVSLDPYFDPQQWALQNTGTFADGIAGDDIKAPGAWDTTTGISNVVIAVLDTGIDYTHQDLAVNMWKNPGETNCANGIDNDNNGYVNDCKGWDFTTCAQFDLSSATTTATATLSGATSATGSATMTVDLNTGAISGTVNFSGLSSPATGAHITGTNVPPISLTGGVGLQSGTFSIPDGTILTTVQLTQLQANGLYVDVESTNYHAGEISGQITLSGALTCITPKEGDNDPMDDVGHGTHVGGIIGAKGDNGIGIAGVMWNVQLMPLKFINAQGYGQVSDEITALQYVSDNVVKQGWNIKAVNASFGSSEFSASEKDAISTLNDNGVLFIAAAGNYFNNNDFTPVFPAGYSNPVFGGLPNIIAVAATDQQDRLASFSGYGMNSVQVAAPGVYILSTVPAGLTFSLCSGSLAAGYDFCSGTSMAAPHVTGLVGLLYSVYDGNVHNGAAQTPFSPSQVRSTILSYLDVLPTLNGWIQTGGRINAYMAVSSLLAPTGLTATPSPTQVILTWSDNATAFDRAYRIEKCTWVGQVQCTNFVDITSGTPLSTFTDSSVSPETTYTYRLNVHNSIADSLPVSTTVTTSATPPQPAPPSGGGGCSIGATQNTPTAAADLAVLFMPLLLVALLRRRR